MEKYSANEIGFLLTNVLRHSPEDIGIKLDSKGWTSIETLVLEANKRGILISAEDVINEVLKKERNRYSLSEDEKMIRANHGHSVPVDVGLKEIIPREVLFHRTRPEFLESILKEGLVPQKRLYVHLATEKEYLTSYKFFGDEDYILLKIDSREMTKDGYVFYASGEVVICTKIVPAKYISIEFTN